MPMPDRINDVYPISQDAFNVTSNGVNQTGIFMKNFNNGFVILYGAINYVDGTHTLEIQDTNAVPIPSEKLFLPEIVQKADPSFDPLVINSAGLVDQASGIARYISVLDSDTDEIIFRVTSSGVTSGSIILLQILAYPTQTPMQFNQLL